MAENVLAHMIAEAELAPNDDDEEQALWHEYDGVDIEHVLPAYRAGVERRVHPYPFRHSWMTEMLRRQAHWSIYSLTLQTQMIDHSVT